MYKILKTVHPGEIRTLELLFRWKKWDGVFLIKIVRTFNRMQLIQVFTYVSRHPIWSQSYDFLIYSYNESIVVPRLERFSKKKKNIFVFKTS
jgi:hypothetical protein